MTPTKLGSCRSPSPSRRGPTIRRPSPPPRRSKLAEEDALRTVGAFYIGWGEGKDPAPLCCPVQKEKIKSRFGEASVGWMTTPAPSQPSPTLPVELPPLPSTSSLDSATQAFIDSFSSTSSSSNTPSLSPPSLLPFDSNSSISYPPFDYAESLSPASSSNLVFTETLALPPSSESLSLPHYDLPQSELASIKVEDDVMSEHLWGSSCSGDDLGGADLFSSSSSEGSTWSW
ncbi:hypothetical protein JCM5353_005992 [Sporobolomyces roseus]